MEAGFQGEGMSRDGGWKREERDSFGHGNRTGIIGNAQVGISNRNIQWECPSGNSALREGPENSTLDRGRSHWCSQLPFQGLLPNPGINQWGLGAWEFWEEGFEMSGIFS